MENLKTMLQGKRPDRGIANDNSIAYGCARVLRDLGAEFAVTYLNRKADRLSARWPKSWKSPIITQMNVENRANWKPPSRPSKKMGQAGFCHPLDRLLPDGRPRLAA